MKTKLSFQVIYFQDSKISFLEYRLTLGKGLQLISRLKIVNIIYLSKHVTAFDSYKNVHSFKLPILYK